MEDKSIDNQPILDKQEGSELVSAKDNTISHESSNMQVYTLPTSLINNTTSPIDSSAHPRITKNQPNEAQIRNVKKALRTKKQRLLCPYCGTQTWTNVETRLNVCNLFFCLCGLLPWCVVKCCQN